MLMPMVVRYQAELPFQDLSCSIKTQLLLDKDYNHPWPFYCAFLQTIRKCPEVGGRLQDSFSESPHPAINDKNLSVTPKRRRLENNIHPSSDFFPNVRQSWDDSLVKRWDTVLSLITTPALLYHEDTAQCTKSFVLWAFLVFRLVFMAKGELPYTERIIDSFSVCPPITVSLCRSGTSAGLHSELRVETEIWAYSTISFIAEMGGALGLFVGFSFLSVWDCLAILFEKYKHIPV